jgi:hypothetical protein
MLSDIKFENNGYIYRCINFDKKTNTLIANQFDTKENFIKKIKIKMGQIPKNIKRKINPLK